MNLNVPAESVVEEFDGCVGFTLRDGVVEIAMVKKVGERFIAVERVGGMNRFLKTIRAAKWNAMLVSAA